MRGAEMRRISQLAKLAVVGLLLAATSASLSLAQETAWPRERPIRLIVPFQAGSYSDVIARIVTQKLAERLGQTIVIDNRTGAAGSLGASAAARAPADGYTMLLGGGGPMIINALMAADPVYDPVKDFVPASLVGNSPFVILASPHLPAKNIEDLIALAKQRPAALNYASSGIGTMAHLVGALLEKMADIRLVHVPYRGTEQSIIDLMEGRIDLVMATMAPSLPLIREGKVRALATTGSKRSARLLDVPTVAEQGLAGYDAELWTAFVLPAASPASVIARVNRDTNAVVSFPEIRAALEKQGISVDTATPAELSSRVRDDVDRWSALIRDAGLKPK
jgi:tripartite-type tricarboxylate transporter receptor subunit TctC